MAKKSIDKLLSEKLDFLDFSESRFLNSIDIVEKNVLKRVLKILRSLSQSEGRIIQDEASKKLLLRFKKEILGAIRKSAFVPKVSKFLTDFDEVESLNKNIYKRSLKRKKLGVNLSLEKQIVIDSVVDSLKTDAAVTANFVNPIKKTLTDAVRLNQTFAEAESNLKKLISGAGGESSGLLKRYSTQVTRDALQGFDGAVNDTIRDAFQLDAFRYVGSLIKDSRQNCKEWVNGSGRFKKYAIRAGTFRTKDLPAMIRIARNRSGFRPETTPANFAEKRGGYNCRHQVFYFTMTKEQNEKVEEQLATA